MPLARTDGRGVGTPLFGRGGGGRRKAAGHLAPLSVPCGLAENAGEFAPPLDAEFPVSAGKVFLDCLHGHEKLLRDLPVGAAAGRAPRYPQLARRQRLDTADTGASRPSPRGQEFLAGALRDHDGPAAVGEVQRGTQRLS